MPIENVNNWSEYGLGGLVIAALFAFLIYVVKIHKEERSEWVDAYKEQSRIADSRQSETNAVLRDLVAVVKEVNIRDDLK
mgnify:CR=1 FL=1